MDWRFWPLGSPTFPSSAFRLLAGIKANNIAKTLIREPQTQPICPGPVGWGCGRAYQPSTPQHQHLVSIIILLIL